MTWIGTNKSMLILATFLLLNPTASIHLKPNNNHVFVIVLSLIILLPFNAHVQLFQSIPFHSNTVQVP